MMLFFYRVFHGFGQAKCSYGGLVLGLSQFTPLLPVSTKDSRIKKAQLRKTQSKFFNFGGLLFRNRTID